MSEIQHIIGWDCANKSLGWCVIEVNCALLRRAGAAMERLRAAGIGMDMIRQKCAVAQCGGDIELMRCCRDVYIADNWCNIVAIGVVDLHPGEKTPSDDVLKARRLRSWLEGAFPDGKWAGHDLIVAVEHQPRHGMTPNTASFSIQAQLAFYFAHCDLQMISPKLKNKLDVGGGICRGPTYADRKDHARRSLVAWDYAAAASVPRQVLDDAGDAFLTAYVRAVKYVNGL
jgi:hypothetical protein